MVSRPAAAFHSIYICRTPAVDPPAVFQVRKLGTFVFSLRAFPKMIGPCALRAPWLLFLFLALGRSFAHGGGIGGLPEIAYKCSEGNATTVYDKELSQVALNLEYLEAEFFLWGSVGYGLDKAAPWLVGGGPKPLGTQKANLSPYYTDLFYQLGLQEVGHITIIKKSLGDPPRCAFPRTLLDLSKRNWAETIGKAIEAKFGKKLYPPFNPYEDSLKFLISAYTIPYVGLTGYVGASPLLTGYNAKALVAGLLGVESGQDAVIRTELYRQKFKIVYPYPYTVADFTSAISTLRNDLSHAFVDEGLVVPKALGADQKVVGNILAGDKDSISYSRTPKQLFQTVYGTGDAGKPGGFYPKGGQGVISKTFLEGIPKKADDEGNAEAEDSDDESDDESDDSDSDSDDGGDD